jgi:hypothetical protein
MAPVVQWLKAQPVRQVYGLSYKEDRYLRERFSEMLYPIPYRTLDPEAVSSGDLIVLPRGREPAPSWVLVIESGEMRVFRGKE